MWILRMAADLYMQYMGFFCEIDVFPLGVFSIRNFNLRNLKGNGNTVSDYSISS